jgi:hypothetical protein
MRMETAREQRWIAGSIIESNLGIVPFRDNQFRRLLDERSRENARSIGRVNSPPGGEIIG